MNAAGARAESPLRAAAPAKSMRALIYNPNEH